ncbi:MAG: hypothetical protein KTR19_03730 [Hyphomicrobiales bacterium]|nr:hypothetical protein [Hyphomicrobiales bacterium]
MTINGRNVVTSRGTAVDANYDRHHIDFIVPAGEPDEGGQFRADQLNDNQIRVILIEANGKQKGEPEIWTPCKPVS